MDSSRLEIIIQNLLKDHDTTYVADDLLKKWDRGELSQKDQNIAAQFLIQSGFLQTLQSQFSKQFTQDRHIAWIPFLEMVSLSIEKLPDEVVEPILVGMTESNQLEDLIYVQKAKKLHPRFKKLIHTFLEDKTKNLSKEKNELKEKLKRHINDRMDNEVQTVSKILKEKFPVDKEIAEITSDLDLVRIRNLIQKKEREIQQEPLHKNTITAAEKSVISNDAIKNAKKNPTSAYDLAILLTQMEVYDDALICLSYAPESLEKDWLRLDLLIKSENFIDAMNESFEIEKKYTQSPETIFQTLLLRAQALFGLGEKERAIQILETLLETTPRNHTAKILLHSWRNA